MPVDGISQKAYAGAPEARRLSPVTAGKSAPVGASKVRSPDSILTSPFPGPAKSIPARFAGLLADAVLLTVFAPFYAGWTAYRAIQRWRGKPL